MIQEREREREKYKSNKVVLLWHRLLVYLSCGCGQYAAAVLLLGLVTAEDCNGFWSEVWRQTGLLTAYAPRWRALCFWDSNFACRVLMAGTVHLQRLAKHSLKRAAALLLCTAHWDISLTTSSMQRFEMSQFLLWFFFYYRSPWRRDKRCGKGKSTGHELDTALTAY